MAKKSSIERNDKRKKLVLKHQDKRKKLKEEIAKATGEKRMRLQHELAKLPVNSCPTRVRNRCELTGRPRGVYRKFRLSRNMLRLLAMEGCIPGIMKSSW